MYAIFVFGCQRKHSINEPPHQLARRKSKFPLYEFPMYLSRTMCSANNRNKPHNNSPVPPRRVAQIPKQKHSKNTQNKYISNHFAKRAPPANWPEAQYAIYYRNWMAQIYDLSLFWTQTLGAIASPSTRLAGKPIADATVSGKYKCRTVCRANAEGGKAFAAWIFV